MKTAPRRHHVGGVLSDEPAHQEYKMPVESLTDEQVSQLYEQSKGEQEADLDANGEFCEVRQIVRCTVRPVAVKRLLGIGSLHSHPWLPYGENEADDDGFERAMRHRINTRRDRTVQGGSTVDSSSASSAARPYVQSQTGFEASRLGWGTLSTQAW